MKQLFPRGKRIRPTDKDLVFHTALAALFPVFLLVILLFHIRQIAGTNWQEVSLSQITQDVNIPYLLFSMGVAGIALPRTAQEQYNVTQHIPLSEAKAGDLVFFHSTYNAGTYITHVGLYVGNNRMYHAGNPIGYADLTGSYWQQHLAGAGRIKQ